MMRLKRVLEGLASVAIGVMLIANSVGALSWRVWWILLSLWPLLLVAIGLDLLGKGMRLNIIRVVSSLLVLAGLAYAVSLAPTSASAWKGAWSRGAEFSSTATEARGAQDAKLELSLPATRLSVRSGDEVFSASGRIPFGEPELSEKRRGDDLELEFRSEGGVPFVMTGGDSRVDVELGRDQIWELDIDLGATDATLDLSDLSISAAAIDAGVGVVDLSLGDPIDGEVRVGVSTGISDTTVRIPQGAEARVEVRTGLGGADVPDDWSRVRDMRAWETPGYSSAEERYLIVIEGGIGSVRIVR